MWLFSIFTEKSFPATLTSVINKHEKIMMQTERSKELQKFNIYKLHSNFNLEFTKESVIWSILIQE